MYGYGPPHFQDFRLIPNYYQAKATRFNFGGSPNHRYRSYNEYPGQNNPKGSPSSIEHWCETCDRSFPTVDLLQKHLQQHQKCNIDGCQFVAHPKVVTKHIQMQHASGLYKKIAKLNNPEEIQKWREERKRKYPTKLNIEKKAAERKEKLERGEKMGLKSDGLNRNFKNAAMKRKSCYKDDYQHKRQKHVMKNTVNYEKKMSLPKKVHMVLPVVNNVRKLKPFAGIQDIIMTCSNEEENKEMESPFDIEDDDDQCIINNTTELDKSEPKVCGALSSLMCDYESADEDAPEEKLNNNSEHSHVNKIINNYKLDVQSNLKDQFVSSKANTNNNKDTVEKENEQKTELNQENNSTDNCNIKSNNQVKNDVDVPESIVSSNKCNNQSDDESGPEEIKNSKPSENKTENKSDQVSSNNNELTVRKSKLDDSKLKKYCHKKPKPKVPSTLLRKLLRREIEQERNIVLQCIRFVVNNDFFDKKT